MDQFGLRVDRKMMKNKGGGRREASIPDKGGKIGEKGGKGGRRSVYFG